MENKEETMFCPNCGTKVAVGTRFCPHCGAVLDNPTEPEESASVSAPDIATVRPSAATVETAASQQPQPATPAQAAAPNNRHQTLFLVLGWLSAAASLMFVPIIFGLIGVIFGYLVRNRGRKEAGTILLCASIAFAILGTIIGAIMGAARTGL